MSPADLYHCCKYHALHTPLSQVACYSFSRLYYVLSKDNNYMTTYSLPSEWPPYRPNRPIVKNLLLHNSASNINTWYSYIILKRRLPEVIFLLQAVQCRTDPIPAYDFWGRMPKRESNHDVKRALGFLFPDLVTDHSVWGRWLGADFIWKSCILIQ